MKHFLIALLVLLFCKTAAQTEKEVLKRAQIKVEQINNCSYLMYYHAKLNGMRDTAYETGSVTFTRAIDDTLLGVKIRIDNYKGVSNLYNGLEYIEIRKTDSSAYIWNVNRFDYFKNTLLLNRLSFPAFFQKRSIFSNALMDSATSWKFLNDTTINEATCFSISCSANVTEKGESSKQVLTTLYIRKADYLPIGYEKKMLSSKSLAYKNYENAMLEDVEINQIVDHKIFTLESVPPSYSLKQQAGIFIKNYINISEAIPNLQPNILAQIQACGYLKNKNLLLIFIDSGNCIPCRNTFELINEIYPEIKNNVIPVIVSDKKSSNNYEFLKTQGKYFPDYFENSQLLKESKLCVYPTFFLLNKEWQTVYKAEGFNIGLKLELPEEIQKLGQ